MYQLAGEGKCVAFFEYERMTLGIVRPPELNFDLKFPGLPTIPKSKD